MQNSAKHPGALLMNEYMRPLGLNALRLALALRVAHNRILEILHGRRGISAETALRLAKLFGTTPRYWLELQLDYDLAGAVERHGQEIENDIQPMNLPPHLSGIHLPGAKETTPDSKVLSVTMPELTDSQQVVFAILSETPMHFDDIFERSGLSVGELSGTLTMLELNGLAAGLAGDRYARSSERLRGRAHPARR